MDGSEGREDLINYLQPPNDNDQENLESIADLGPLKLIQ